MLTYQGIVLLPRNLHANKRFDEENGNENAERKLHRDGSTCMAVVIGMMPISRERLMEERGDFFLQRCNNNANIGKKREILISSAACKNFNKVQRPRIFF